MEISVSAWASSFELTSSMLRILGRARLLRGDSITPVGIVIAKTFGMEKLVELAQGREPAGLGGRRKSPACKISYDTADVFGTGPWPAWFPET
jgi:hypothetical protein